jgi:hypothetical protein
MGECSIQTVNRCIIKAILTGVQLKRDMEILFERLNNAVRTTGMHTILLDIEGIEEISGGARRNLMAFISREPYLFEKLAFFGPTAKNKVMAKFIITASGKGNSVRYFENEEDSINWLMD